jgi:hypothetical protein
VLWLTVSTRNSIRLRSVIYCEFAVSIVTIALLIEVIAFQRLPAYISRRTHFHTIGTIVSGGFRSNILYFLLYRNVMKMPLGGCSVVHQEWHTYYKLLSSYRHREELRGRCQKQPRYFACPVSPCNNK